MLGKPHEECGLFGIYNQDDLDVAEKTYLALYAFSIEAGKRRNRCESEWKDQLSQGCRHGSGGIS